MSQMTASIRADLYLQDLLIPATELTTGKQKHLDPIMWESIETTDTGQTLLRRPEIAGGGLYEFDSIDLDFEN
jgi:hypothetical protein